MTAVSHGKNVEDAKRDVDYLCDDLRELLDTRGISRDAIADEMADLRKAVRALRRVMREEIAIDYPLVSLLGRILDDWYLAADLHDVHDKPRLTDRRAIQRIVGDLTFLMEYGQ